MNPHYSLFVSLWKAIWTYLAVLGVVGAADVANYGWPDSWENVTNVMLFGLLPALWRFVENLRKNYRADGKALWEWKIPWVAVLAIVVGTVAMTGCAFTKYDEHGNVIEHWEPPTPEQLEGYLTSAERLAALIDKFEDDKATEEDKNTVDRLLDYAQSDEGQEAMERANDRTSALIQQLLELRQARTAAGSTASTP